MTECDALLAGIVAEPREEARWAVLADWLEERDEDPRRAELLRLHRKLLATCREPDAHPERAGWQARLVELLVAGVRPCVPTETLALPGGAAMAFAFVPPGAFLMGSDRGSTKEPRPHRVEVAEGFFLGVYPVTQAQWAAVTGARGPGHHRGPGRPVESASREECLELFCARLSAQTGRRVGLPTDAEWEYACRAGTTTEYPFGDVISEGLANYKADLSWNGSPLGKHRKRTTDVGSFPPNPWGLYDLIGNVWEWCSSDTYEESSNLYGVARGGCHGSNPNECRAAYRAGFLPNARSPFCGLRVRLGLAGRPAAAT